MNRRDNLKLMLAGSAGFLCQNRILANPVFGALPENGALEYIFPEIEKQALLILPQNTRVSFGWNAFGVKNEESATRFFLPEKQKINTLNKEILFRISVAIDMREEVTLCLQLAEDKIKIGEIDIKYSPPLQIHECKIHNVYFDKIQKQGLQIFVSTPAQSTIWLYEKAVDQFNEPTIFQPHFLVYKKKRISKRSYFDQLFSENSLQPFGWMEGCVLDGLWQMQQHKTFTGVSSVIETHFSRYFNQNNELIYEDARSRVSDNQLSTIEVTLPFAILAIQQPNHPYLQKAEEFWKNKELKNGLIIDGDMVSAEGNYTVAYPLAVLGKLLNREDLIVKAFKQLRLRKNRLIFENDFYLRYYAEDKRTFKNWARGVAWYLLGLVRTLHILHDREDMDDLKEEFERAAMQAIKFQRKDGLWNCFIDDEQSFPDTSGSAGIAAAIAAGCSTGLLPYYLSTRTERTWEGLMDYLTPDGFLSGAAQSNKGGEKLQRSEYRVISQMGMGLMAQLYAFL